MPRHDIFVAYDVIGGEKVPCALRRVLILPRKRLERLDSLERPDSRDRGQRDGRADQIERDADPDEGNSARVMIDLVVVWFEKFGELVAQWPKFL